MIEADGFHDKSAEKISYLTDYFKQHHGNHFD